MAPLISIIIPVYNVEKYIHRCLDSVLNQTLKNIEIILVDDKSPDNCPKICDEYALKDKRIKVIHKEKNEGLGLARNSGLDIAQGKFVAFIDSDDFIDHNMYEDLYNHAVMNKCDTVFCSLNFFENNHVTPFKEVSKEMYFEGPEIKQFLLDMVGPNPSFKSDVKYMVSVWKAIYSKEIISKHKIHFLSEREIASEDMIFHIDYLSKTQKITFIPKFYYFYVKNTSSISHTYTKEKIQRLKNFLIEVSQKLSLLYPEEEYKTRVYRKYLHYLRIALQIHIKMNTQFFSCLQEIKNECSDEFYHSFIKEYPYKQLPIKHKIFFIAVKYKLKIILWAMLKLSLK